MFDFNYFKSLFKREKRINIVDAMDICDSILSDFESNKSSVTEDEFLLMCEHHVNKYMKQKSSFVS